MLFLNAQGLRNPGTLEELGHTHMFIVYEDRDEAER